MSTIHFIGGEKGGVGKSVVARLCAQYLIDRALPFLALDADGSHGSLLRHYADYTRPVDLERSESVDEILTLATETERRVLVDLPSHSDRPLSKWIAVAGVLDLARESNVGVVFWHVMDDGKDSVLMLDRGGLFEFLERRLEAESHALIVVAEGAGQEHCRPTGEGAVVPTDASGNMKLSDIGIVLRDKIIERFKRKRVDVTVKYIDPSYYIRSVPAAPADSVYCWNLARNAVHAGMAGNTDMIIGRWHGRFVHVPMPLATRFRKQVDVQGDLWAAVVEATGQPAFSDSTMAGPGGSQESLSQPVNLRVGE